MKSETCSCQTVPKPALFHVPLHKKFTSFFKFLLSMKSLMGLELKIELCHLSNMSYMEYSKVKLKIYFIKYNFSLWLKQN
jgi:hypothetical protein